MSLRNFPWPRVPAHAGEPRWTGHNFAIGSAEERILSYAVETSHWSDDLTAMHEAEAGENHPIDRASRRLAVASMMLIKSPTPTIMDVGCSSGFVLHDLRENIPNAELMGSDYLHGPLENLARRMQEIPILQFDLRQCPLPSECLDGITCLNVLEHVDEDRKSLAEIFRILKPGGIAHIEVPAGPELYDIYDEYLMHHRRYRLKELEAMASECGFVVEKATHLGCLVFPAFWWVKKFNRRKMHFPPERKRALVAGQIRSTKTNPLMKAAMRLETAMGKILSFPWGIRCIVRLRKPNTQSFSRH